MRGTRAILLLGAGTFVLAWGALCGFAAAGVAPEFSFQQAQGFLKTHCQACHGPAASGGFRIASLSLSGSLASRTGRWNRVAQRVRNGEMPPAGVAAPAPEAREAFVTWVESAVRQAACGSPSPPSRFPVRRLNRDEYSATVRDLLNIHMDVGHALPADGAGGEGFDNAAETLFLSPLHAEKYLESAQAALSFAFSDSRARATFLIAQPGPELSPRDAAQRILQKFLPRAFRRPVRDAEVDRYLSLFLSARGQGQDFEPSVQFALQGVLMAPEFLFRLEALNTVGTTPDYRLASRLSYFLWGTMPDEMLLDLAEMGRLRDPEVLKYQVGRMLRSPRSMVFAQRFTEQWLRTRELGRDVTPDPKLFPAFTTDDELRADIRYQPIVFFREILMKNGSVLDLIDSDWTIATRKLLTLYFVKPPLKLDRSGQPQRVALPAGTNRGGVLGMAAVLAVSSHPHRTSPVLRGKWILDTLLGAPPPPPPPDVPALEEHSEVQPKTMRERL